MTVDEEMARDTARTALEIIYQYAVRAPKMRAAAAGGDPGTLRHIVRSSCLTEMRHSWAAAWRDIPAQERAFNSACRAMGWFKRGKPVALDVRSDKARTLGLDIGQRDKATIPGLLLTDQRLAELEAFLFGDTNGSGGDGRDYTNDRLSDMSDTCPIRQNPKETAVSDSPMEAPTRARGNVNDINGLARASRDLTVSQDIGHVPPYLEGAAAIEAARAILTTPGLCGIDFETYPTDPAFHAEQAAAAAPRGKKGEAGDRARLAAVMNGRAHVRRPCTLQLAHENGSEAFIRLAPGDDPGPRRQELQAMFGGRQATMVAHNAQFETECLLAHGVAVDIHCTWIAARCLYLVAVDEKRGQKQPQSFSLAALVEKEFGRTRDKAIRDRDWRLEESIDDEAIEYGLQDARDAVELCRVYHARLEQEGLLEGYAIYQAAVLPTAQLNMNGLALDVDAHADLMRTMHNEARDLERELYRICDGRVANPGSTVQVSNWILSEVLERPVKPPLAPKVAGLLDFLKSRGGLRPDPGGELKARDLPRSFVNLTGLSLEDATIAAWEGGYIGLEHDRFSADAGRPEEGDLLAAIDRELHGDRVLRLEDQGAWDAYQAEMAEYERLYRDDPELFANFNVRLQVRCGTTWPRTESGHLKLSKGLKSNRAEQLAAHYPYVSRYLLTHLRWNRATKLLDGFGATLRRWLDTDGRIRGQFKIHSTWTGRHGCTNPNLQNQPREAAFRALWVARPGRKLVIADYSQIELRLAAIESGDERLREVYREGRDVHAETASIITMKPLDQVTKADRQPAKGCNFLAIYGGGAVKLAETIGCSIEHARTILDRFFTAYAGLAHYRETAPQAAMAAGQINLRPHRRVRYIEGSGSPTQAINAPIQGSAASVQMRALRLVYNALRAHPDLDVQLAASVHDEVILDAAEEHAAEAAKLLVDCMTQALVEIYPEAEEQGLARLTAAGICSAWSEKE